jgi:hypothetical protein
VILCGVLEELVFIIDIIIIEDLDLGMDILIARFVVVED